MVMAASAPSQFPHMAPTPSYGYPNGFQDDSAPGPSQPIPSQRLLSQMLPAQLPRSQSIDARPGQSSSTPFRASVSPSSRSIEQSSDPSASNLKETPRKTSLMLSHPPPAPSHSTHQHTPQPKRSRLSGDDPRPITATTSPLSRSPNTPFQPSGSSAHNGNLSSPSPSNVRPLSGISRPLPLPPTPSPSQRNLHSTTSNAPLTPLPRRSIQDFEKLLSQRRAAPVPPSRADVAQRPLLQAIPPQPPLPPPPVPVRPGAAAENQRPPRPAVEPLPRRREWLTTGFHSLDIDLERIARVHSLEQRRRDQSQRQADSAGDDEDSSPDTSRNGRRISNSLLGSPDYGLPSGSILEVLGPPGSGKTSMLVQFAVTERLRALGRARRDLAMHDDDAVQTAQLETEGPATSRDTGLAPSSYFSEDFWDAEVATSDQVLMLDCEGALTAEQIADAAWSAAITLWHSSRHQQEATENSGAVGSTSGKSTSPVQQQRAEMPEVVRRLVAAILAGIHVSRVTSLAGMIALLHSLRPTDEYQDAQVKGSLPSSLPPRTSLILIDSLSYHIRLSGGSSQDRKAAVQVSERVRDMLLRLQQPFEYRPTPDLTAEERQAAKQRSMEAAAKLCTPTIVFTNQLGIRRSQNDRDGTVRSSPTGYRASTGPGRSFGKSNARGETSSMLAPVLNGQRPPQPAQLRDERPAPSVALCGPEMWDDEGVESTAAATPRQVHQLRGRGPMHGATQHMGHDRGWPPSFLGQDAWRILLFRHGTFGHRYAQMVSIPPGVQSELSNLWVQTRERVRTHAQVAAQQDTTISGAATGQQVSPGSEGQNEQQQSADTTSSQAAESSNIGKGMEQQRDEQMLELLSQLRASLFRWRPFTVTSKGLS